jgi:hypothetical protein
MKTYMTALGIVLIVFGALILGYKGYTYTKHETVAQIGDLQLSADTQKTVYISPIWGGASLAAGIILVVVARNKSD